ncbi:MAG: hypothetical protein ACRBBQ_12505 [Cognatishimia sp.]
MCRDEIESQEVTEQSPEIDNLDDAIEFTNHIIGTHFSTFSYIDTKLQALLAISSLFLAGFTFVYASFAIESNLAVALLLVAAVVLFGSIMVCVWHVTPKLNSGIGNETNLRSAIGTSPLTKEEYHGRICNLSKADMLEMNCHQISGLSRINTSGGWALKMSSIAIGLAVVLFCAAFAVNGIPEKQSSEGKNWSFTLISISQANDKGDANGEN